MSHLSTGRIGEINESGNHGAKITLKFDQEEAIVSLKKGLAVKRQAEVVLVEFPVKNSRASGAAERAVRSWAAS